MFILQEVGPIGGKGQNKPTQVPLTQPEDKIRRGKEIRDFKPDEFVKDIRAEKELAKKTLEEDFKKLGGLRTAALKNPNDKEAFLNFLEQSQSVARKAEQARDPAIMFAMYLTGNKSVKIDNGRILGFLWKRPKKDSPTVRELLDKYEPTPAETLEKEDQENTRKGNTQLSRLSMLRQAKLFYASWDKIFDKYPDEVKAYEKQARSRGLIE